MLINIWIDKQNVVYPYGGIQASFILLLFIVPQILCFLTNSKFVVTLLNQVSILFQTAFALFLQYLKLYYYYCYMCYIYLWSVIFDTTTVIVLGPTSHAHIRRWTK